MMPLESSISDTTIWSIRIDLSITILDASFTLIYDVYSTGITYDGRNIFIALAQVSDKKKYLKCFHKIFMSLQNAKIIGET